MPHGLVRYFALSLVLVLFGATSNQTFFTHHHSATLSQSANVASDPGGGGSGTGGNDPLPPCTDSCVVRTL